MKLKRENEKLIFEKLRPEKLFDFRKPYFDCKPEQRRSQRIHITTAIVSKCHLFLKSLGLSIVSITLSKFDENCEPLISITENTQLKEAGFKTPLVVRMLYCKLRYLISDKAWMALRNYSRDEFQACPSLYALRSYQKKINKTVEIFTLDDGKGAYVDFMKSLSSRLRVVVTDYSIKPTEELVIRISADTFNTLKCKVLPITYTVINETKKCKAARGNYILGLFKVYKESYEEVKECFNNCFKMIQKDFKSINIDNKTYKVCVVYCCDMKMTLLTIGNLAANSKNPCMLCTVEKSELHSIITSKKRSFPEKIGEASHSRESLVPKFVATDNIVVDVLHMETAIGTVIINDVVKMLFASDNISESTKLFDPKIHLGLKRFIDFLNDINIKYNFSTSENTSILSGRSFNRSEVRKIINKIKIENLLPTYKNKEAFQRLVDALDAIMLKLRNNLITADELQRHTFKWLELYKKLQHRTLVTPYMHTLVHHVPDMVRRFNGIHQFTLEGAEKKYHIIKSIIFRGTNLKEPYVMAKVMYTLEQIEILLQKMIIAGDYLNEDNPAPKTVFNELIYTEYHKEKSSDIQEKSMNLEDDFINDVISEVDIVDPDMVVRTERELQIDNESVFLNVNGTEWLENLHLIKYFQILKKQYPHINGLCDPRLLYNTNYKPKISNGNTVFIFNTEKPSTTHYGSHWIVITNIKCNNDCWRIYDSAATNLKINENIKQFIKKISDTDKDLIQIEVPSVQLQYNGYDCGLFALAFIQSLAESIDPSTVHYNQAKMRENYNASIQKNKILPFPIFPRKRLQAKSVNYSFQIQSNNNFIN